MEEEVARHINYALEKCRNLSDILINKQDKTKLVLMKYQKFASHVFWGLETLNLLLLFWETGFGKTVTFIYILNLLHTIYPDWKYIYIYKNIITS